MDSSRNASLQPPAQNGEDNGRSISVRTLQKLHFPLDKTSAIAERKQTEEQFQFQATPLRYVTDSVIVTDLQGEIVMKKSILVVDDSQPILDVMSAALEAEGYEVSTSLTGAYFLRMERNLPDLILLDVLLSGEDGGEICQRLKRDERTRHIPVILISAHAGLQETAQRCGADGFLVKPFHLAELREMVERYAG